jgi:hypothetical protein
MAQMSTLIGAETGNESTAAMHSQCRLWVKSRHVRCNSACPLSLQKRTCAVQTGMSALPPKAGIFAINRQLCDRANSLPPCVDGVRIEFIGELDHLSRQHRSGDRVLSCKN